ncbi:MULTISPECIES: hypothetical protein [Clostridium]|uniref:PH domain-containing protein n=1 Tax=Clostridium frigoriphilum TaxID=443253 RepID=A0ABU7UVJ4_9CLOT|nr:hypothetical protein [Clostridium sp. DSM 17811]MBU3102392.1 hypothetical protein [Clostridium sp. DSM 17811]
MYYQSKFSFSKFVKLFLGRAVLIGGPGVIVCVYLFLIKGPGPVIGESSPEVVLYVVGIIITLAVFSSIFLAPAFFIGPLNQLRKSDIKYINGVIVYNHLKSGWIGTYNIYNLYTINKISYINITSKKITIEGDISLEVIVNNRCKKNKDISNLKIPNVFNGIEFMSSINTNSVIWKREL